MSPRRARHPRAPPRARSTTPAHHQPRTAPRWQRRRPRTSPTGTEAAYLMGARHSQEASTRATPRRLAPAASSQATVAPARRPPPPQSQGRGQSSKGHPERQRRRPLPPRQRLPARTPPAPSTPPAPPADQLSQRPPDYPPCASRSSAPGKSPRLACRGPCAAGGGRAGACNTCACPRPHPHLCRPAGARASGSAQGHSTSQTRRPP